MMWKLVLPVFAAVFAVGFSASMTGGFHDIDVNDTGANNALKAAVVEYNRGTNDLFHRKVAEVVAIKRQVVGGLKYVITVNMAKTSCRKGSPIEVCEIPQDPAIAQPYQCTFTVYTRPWLNITNLLKHECQE